MTLLHFADCVRKQEGAVAARPIYARSLAIMRKTSDPFYPYLAIAQSKQAVADRLFSLASKALEEKLGPAQWRVSTCQLEWAVACARQNRKEQAEDLLQRALAGFDKTLGPDHPTVLIGQARYWTVAGDREKALQYLTRSVQLDQVNYDIVDNPDLAALKSIPEYRSIVATVTKCAAAIGP